MNTESLNFFLQEQLEQQLATDSGVGAMALVMENDTLLGSACAGERKLRSGVPVSAEDKWHIGSITKSFTATLAAKYIERGHLTWSTRIEDVFDSVSKLHPQWREVTLHQLLTHTSGSPENFPIRINLKRPKTIALCKQERFKASALMLSKPPRTIPDFMFRYSNLGYSLAGVMVEQIADEPWEQLLEKEIFTPLGMNSAGFGPPRDEDDRHGQPRGHYRLLGLRISSMQDNSAVMGPAGTLHMNLQDLCKYGYEHMRGLSGTGILLQQETYRRLHQPLFAKYSCGWAEDLDLQGFSHRNISHNGSNTLWYAVLVMAPEQNLIAALAFNDAFDLDQKMVAAENMLVRILLKLTGE